MRLKWTLRAAADLEHIADYLFARTPFHAPRVIRNIYDAPSMLLVKPSLGRKGRKAGTRELPLPYVVIYIVGDDVVSIARILHGAPSGLDIGSERVHKSCATFESEWRGLKTQPFLERLEQNRCLRRYRVKNFRLLCRLEEIAFVVLVIRVGHRKNVCER